ncbi:uncharacterized protein IAS62_004732 [Cryptococcus decagattii]|uniref:Uncharacterized protein n=1 Tax=Cryptococcus decagattii TaxID=1859122 RepID=A0ABZ2AXW0_9TREE
MVIMARCCCLSGLSIICHESTNANQLLHFHLNSRSSACIDHGESVKVYPNIAIGQNAWANVTVMPVSVFFLPSFLSLLCCVPTLSSTRSSTFFCWDVHSLLAIAFFIPILPLISDRIPTMLFSTTLLLTLAHFPQFRIRYTLSHRVLHTTAFFIGSLSAALPIHAREIVRQAELHSDVLHNPLFRSTPLMIAQRMNVFPRPTKGKYYPSPRLLSGIAI